MVPTQPIDPSFTALPLHRLADAALQRTKDFGVVHADFRLERIRTQDLSLRDAALQGAADNEQLGFAVRVVLDGTWGFASTDVLTKEAAVRTAEEAIRVAQVAKPINSEPIVLADEPVHPDRTWVSAYDIDPFTVPLRDKVGLLAEWSGKLLRDPVVAHVTANLRQVFENKFYADLAGTTTTQQRVRLYPVLEAFAVDEASGRFDSMRTIAPPVGRGWEYLTGTGWDWPGELDEIPTHLAEKLAAPSVEPGTYDLVVDPSNLWLTIHESIGHATELDRALGYEANYAGTSFATVDKLGSLQYGSPALQVTGDRTVEHGLSSIGYDDEGTQTREWDLIEDGVLVGYQLDRRMAPMLGLDRSNGCAFADSPGHIPIQRMANVSIKPSDDDVSTDDLVSGMERGIYVVGDKSWSIDMQRYNFQFTGQRFYRVENGRITGQLRDVAYQATTTDFWGAMEAVGGPRTWVLGGAFNCGKAQPGQVAPVSHGCPSALFRDIRILNTAAESGR
ncbi:MAG TPA: TldD/PmbA family protein [Nocardioidaceae bacterium]|nr:TldD/PmbA family protein [Nocardioidaceae bacterium]